MRCLDFVFLVVFVFLFNASSNYSRFRVCAARHRRHNHHSQQQQQTPASPELNSSIAPSLAAFSSPELMIVRRVYDDCQDKNDFLSCLKQKALVALSRALDRDSIKVVDGLVLERQNQTEKESVIGAFTDARSLGGMSPLDRSLVSKLDKLMRTYALKIDMSTGRGGGGGGGGGGGKKGGKKGHMKYVIAALVTAMGIAGPLGLKALAAVAIKALVISKVALTIASIIALKKLFAHEGHEETSFQVHAGDHNRRSTYVVRPVTKTSALPASPAAMSASSVEPYRYYYEYH